MKQVNDQILFSKVFLIGEYSACQYGRGILICHAPTFEFQLSHTHPQDTLMEKVTKEFPVLKQYGLHINAPHKDLGGFGQSSATFRAIANILKMGAIHPNSINEWYEWYLKFTWPSKKDYNPVVSTLLPRPSKDASLLIVIKTFYNHVTGSSNTLVLSLHI